jgi:hypothetical protein
VQLAVEKPHKTQKDYADQRRREHSISVGDLVKVKTDHFSVPGLSCRKLKDRYTGPFQVTAQKSSVSFELDLPEHLKLKFPAFHCDKLRLYFSDDEASFPDEPRLPRLPPEDEFLVDKITDVDLDKTETTLMFKVKWAYLHNSDESDSWVPLPNVSETVALDDFLKSTTWQTFAKSRDYRTFRRRYPTHTPETTAA